MTTKEHVCDFIENHDNHICQLVTKVTAGEIIDLVDLPSFICENCARVANNGKNLCRPINLDDVKHQQ